MESWPCRFLMSTLAEPCERMKQRYSYGDTPGYGSLSIRHVSNAHANLGGSRCASFGFHLSFSNIGDVHSMFPFVSHADGKIATLQNIVCWLTQPPTTCEADMLECVPCKTTVYQSMKHPIHPWEVSCDFPFRTTSCSLLCWVQPDFANHTKNPRCIVMLYCMQRQNHLRIASSEKIGACQVQTNLNQ